MTLQEFGQEVKKKYPQYKSIDDVELANKMIEKYPTYKSKITDTTTRDITQSQQKTTNISNLLSPQEKIAKGENIFSKLVNQVSSRATSIKENIMEGAKEQQEGNLGIGKTLERGLRLGGDIAGGIGDVVGAGLEAITPQPVKDVLSSAGKYVMSTPVGKAGVEAIGKGYEAYQGWKSENPEVAKDLEAVVNIASIFPSTKAVSGVGKTVTGTIAQAGEFGLKEATETALKKQGTKEALKIISSKPTKTEAVEAIASGRGKQNIFGTVKIEPNKLDKEVANTIAPIIKNSKPTIKNIDAILNEVTKTNDSVQKLVKETPGIFNEKQILSELNKIKEESGVIFGNEKPQYDAVVDFMNKKISESPKTLEGLLQARKSFDAEIKSKFPKMLGQEAGDNARRNAVLDIRRGVNNYIADKLPEGNLFKEGLRKQHLMLDATDRIAQQIEINKNPLQKLNNFVKNNPATALAGLGGIGGATISGALTNPSIVIPALMFGGSIKIGKKILTSKQLKKIIINSIDAVEKSGRTGLDAFKGLKDIAIGATVLEGSNQLEK